MADIRKIIVLLMTSISVLSCSDMMEISSDRIIYASDNQLDNANDSIYSIMGVLAKVQMIADRCVIMNELRGDLMTVDSDNASIDLQDIEAFNISAGNEYTQIRDFYSVINNCNYIIANMDTTITEGQTKVMMPEYAQAKTLRAWTYLQMGLIFGKVNYLTRPLTTVDDISSTSEGLEVDLDNLTQMLIDDLLPVANERRLDYSTVDGWYSSEFFVPTKMLIGDLYLFNNQYEKAATFYYSLINEMNLNISTNYASYWTSTARDEITDGHLHAFRDEVLTRIAFDSDLGGFHSQMRALTYSETPSLLPATWFTEEMGKRTHFHSNGMGAISRYFNGDLRGCAEYANGKSGPDSFGPATVGTATERILITKFYNNLSGSETDDLLTRPLTSLAIYRPTTLYLRYAESINRLGYPTVAFAVLKYGLSDTTLNDTLRVDSTEIKNLPVYINFSSNVYDSNCGTAARGRGLGIIYDTSQYVIPEGVDKTEYVEEAILDEMAAETCFEGNRFFDLLCVSRHRDNHPQFFAEKVAAKYVDKDIMEQLLMDENRWWAK